MNLRVQVQQTWQTLSSRERKVTRSYAKGSPDAGLRVRCKIVLALVRGNAPVDLIRSRMAASSLVYEVMHRFIDQGLLGLADRREDNGDPKVTEEYEAEILAVVPSSPRKHGYRRPTWTQELLILVLRKRTGIRISRTTMSRVLKRLKIRLGRPKPIVGCPWKKRRRIKRLQELRRLIETLPKDEEILYADEVDIHLNPKIGPDWMLCGTQKTVMTPGKNQKRYLAGAQCADRQADVGRGRSEEQSVVHPSTVAACRPGLPAGQTHPCDPRQLPHPQQPSSSSGLGTTGWTGRAALPAAVLSRSQPHRARLARSA